LKRFKKQYLEAILLYRKIIILVAVQLLFVQLAFSQTEYSWNATSGGDWAIAENWTPNRTTPAASDIILFTDGGSYLPMFHHKLYEEYR